jgi:hypothetical protein
LLRNASDTRRKAGAKNPHFRSADSLHASIHRVHVHQLIVGLLCPDSRRGASRCPCTLRAAGRLSRGYHARWTRLSTAFMTPLGIWRNPPSSLAGDLAVARWHAQPSSGRTTSLSHPARHSAPRCATALYPLRGCALPPPRAPLPSGLILLLDVLRVARVSLASARLCAACPPFRRCVAMRFS